MDSSKLPHGGNPRPLYNVSDQSRLYIDALIALQGSGADTKTAQFIFMNTGIIFTVCQRLIELRSAGIDDDVLEALLKQVFS